MAFLHHMEGVWLRLEAEGADLLMTNGELYTDAVAHAPSKVAGETRFVLDLRSDSAEIMESVAEEARRAAQLEWARASTGLPRFIYVSSGAVCPANGDQGGLRRPERRCRMRVT